MLHTSVFAKTAACLAVALCVLLLAAGCTRDVTPGAYMAAEIAAGAPFTPIEVTDAPFLFSDRTAYENTSVASVTVYACSVTARDNHQYISAFVVDAVSGTVKTALRFYAAAADTASLPLSGEGGAGGLLSLTSDTPVTIAAGETLAFGAAGDPIVWGYRAADADAPASLVGFSCGENFATLRAGDVLCLDVKTVPLDPDAALPEKILAEADVSGHAALPAMAPYLRSASGLVSREEKNASFFHMNLGLFAGTTVDHINVYVTSVEFVDDRQFMTVRVIDTETLQEKSHHRFYADADALDSLTPDRVVSLYCADTVFVGEGETLAFGAVGDPLAWGYREETYSAATELLGFWYRTSYFRKEENGVLGVDVYLKEEPETVDEEKLHALLAGKKLSILGDSISTHSGVSNSTAVNSTLQNNAPWYTGTSRIASVQETWWGQTAEAYGMEILVNNSWSGTSVSNSRARYGAESFGYNTRCLNLHDNTLADNPGGGEIPPDIIAFFMGTNDLSDGKKCGATFDASFWRKIERADFQPDTFDEAYAVSVYKMKQRYPDADLFCFTLPMMGHGGDVKSEARIRYNRAIRAVAEHYGCGVVDLFHTALSSYAAYTHEGLHPREKGMDVITEAFAESLAAWFGK